VEPSATRLQQLFAVISINTEITVDTRFSRYSILADGRKLGDENLYLFKQISIHFNLLAEFPYVAERSVFR
jgi:hypothetical protein